MMVDVLTLTIVERYTFDRAAALEWGARVFPELREEWMDDDAYLVALFEHLNPSPAVEAVFTHDANPKVDVDITREDDEA